MVSHQASRRLLAATAELTTSTARTGYSPLFASSYLPSAVCLSDTLSRATAPRQSSYLAQHRRRYHAFPGPLQRTLALSPGIRSSQCSNRVRANLSNQIRWKSEKSANPSSGDASAQLRSVGFEEITAALPSTSPSSPTHKPSAILVDVREPAELSATGIIPGAVAIPLASQPDAYFLSPDEFETRFGFPKPGVVESGAGVSPADGQAAGGDIIFYCKAGVRARAAAQLAVQAGYDPARIGVYDGSWLDWSDRGGKVEKWEGGE